jgi:hypothetical protein
MEAMQATDSKIGEMSLLESQFFREKVITKYSNGEDLFPLWEFMSSDFYVRDSSAWEWLDEFLKGNEFCFFFDKREEPVIYLFEKNQSLVTFLENFPGYDFYVTNENLDFLISFNDSDYLSASGTAEPWLRQKATELSRSGWKDMDGKMGS